MYANRYTTLKVIFLSLALLVVSLVLYSAGHDGVKFGQHANLRRNIGQISEEEENGIPGMWVCGSPLYPDKTAKLQRPNYRLARMKTKQDEVGDIKTFNTIDFTSETQETKEVVARAERKGTYAYIYVDTTEDFADEDLDEIISVFDGQIYSTNTEVFGLEPRPGIDGDNLITILLLAVDSSPQMVGDIAGYFWSGNQFPKSQVPKSNEREMFYVDISRLNRFGVDAVLGTIAHEFQHLIHWNHDRDEETWINEGLSEYATFVNGLNIANPPSLFLNDTDFTLMQWANHPRDYARAFLWILYLSEHYGGHSLIRNIVANPNHGLGALHASLSQFDPEISIDELFTNWILANYLDGTNPKNGLLTYPSIELPALRPTQTFGFLPVGLRTASVSTFAADYYVFSGGEKLVISFMGPERESDFNVKAIKLSGNSAPEVFDFPLSSDNNGTLTLPDFGVNFEQLVMVPYYVQDSDLNARVNYEFNAEGTGGPSAFSDTLQYHDTESQTVIVLGLPSPVINSEHLDSYAVRFTPPSDGMLVGGEFAVWRRSGSGGTVRFFVYDSRDDSLSVPGLKIDSVDVESVVGTPGTITWNRFDFSDKSIPVRKGENFHLAWEFVNASLVDTVFVILDTARVPTDRSSVFVRERQKWSHFVSQLNFFMKAIVSIPADPTVPKVTAGLLQNPVFSRAIDIFAIGESPLNPVSVEGSFAVGDSVRTLSFASVSDSNKVFIDDAITLRATGVGEIVVSARHKFGTIIGSDTLRVKIDLIDHNTGGAITSADENLQIKLSPKALSNSTYFTVIALEDDFQNQDRDGLIESNMLPTGLGYTVGPPGRIFEDMVELSIYYGENDLSVLSENDLGIAFHDDGKWMILGGELYREEKTISVLVNRTGSYSLVVKRQEEPVVETNVPDDFYLNQNYPNPFNPNTTIKFGLPENRHVTLRIINLKGQIISTLIDAPLDIGVHEVEWDGTDTNNVPVASGVYLYQLQAGDFIDTKKLVVVK